MARETLRIACMRVWVHGVLYPTAYLFRGPEIAEHQRAQFYGPFSALRQALQSLRAPREDHPPTESSESDDWVSAASDDSTSSDSISSTSTFPGESERFHFHLPSQTHAFQLEGVTIPLASEHTTGPSPERLDRIIQQAVAYAEENEADENTSNIRHHGAVRFNAHGYAVLM